MSSAVVLMASKFIAASGVETVAEEWASEMRNMAVVQIKRKSREPESRRPSFLKSGVVEDLQKEG